MPWSSIPAGSTFTLTFGGFAAGAEVRLVIASVPQVLQIVTANSQGVVSFMAVIPLTMSAGEHTIAIIDSSGNGGRQTITVTQQLFPATGSDTNGLNLLALLLLVGGLILVSFRMRAARSLSGTP